MVKKRKNKYDSPSSSQPASNRLAYCRRRCLSTSGHHVAMIFDDD
jgi:hypothetical protein